MRILLGARKILQIPIVAILVTLSLIGITTRVIELLGNFVEPDDRPFTILYLLPVAVGAALLGMWWGIFFAFATIFCAQVFLFNHHGYLMPMVDLSNSIEDASLAIGVFGVAIVTGRLRSALEQIHLTNTQMEEANHTLAYVNAKLVESEQQRRAVNRDVLKAVTGGKLVLVEPEELAVDMPSTPPVYVQVLSVPRDASTLRQCLQDLAVKSGIEATRIQDMCTSVTEAATNAINHGSGGVARAWIDQASVVVLIQDNGTGIAPANLARATLEKGFSTRVSLGMGFYLILDTVDHLILCTSPQGTSLVLTILNVPRTGDGDALLARYASINI